jgi:hypothetical protein
MAVYRFKSRETGDLVMLAPHARRLLGILGKDADQPGIVTPAQMPAAMEAIRTAVAAEEADQQRQRDEAAARGEPEPAFDPVSLRMRTTPFIEMLQRCQRAGVDIVWGV